MYSVPFKQLAPNNSLTIKSVMILPGQRHCNCISLISNEAQGCNLVAAVKGGGTQKLDSAHQHCDHVTAVVSG